MSLEESKIGQEYGLYLHFPYCRQRCTYCDFNSHLAPSNPEGVYSDYHKALMTEITSLPRKRVSSVFWGGGTPSLMPLDMLLEAQAELGRVLILSENIENTIEVNPGTLTTEHFRALKKQGWNRLSLGVQVFQPQLLELVGRIHSVDDVLTTFAAGRKAGFDNISLDLIYGFPKQTLAQWQESLECALKLKPEHISVYCLSVEPTTRLETQLRLGELVLPDEDLRDAMYDRSLEVLEAAGFIRYEISNWALPGRESRHNLAYWRDLPYLAVGCGAVSYVNGWRQQRIKPPVYYQKALATGRSPIVFAERRSADGALKDTLMMGLRIREGVSPAELCTRYSGLDEAQIEAFFSLLPAEWWRYKDGRYSLTQAGWNFHSEVTMKLMDVVFSF